MYERECGSREVVTADRRRAGRHRGVCERGEFGFEQLPARRRDRAVRVAGVP